MEKSTETYETRPVHVLRHRFELSKTLAETLARLLKNESETIRVFGTKQFAVEGFEFYGSKYDTVLNKAGETFRNQDVKIKLQESLRIKGIGNGMARVAFRPARQYFFDMMLNDAEEKVSEFAETDQLLEGVLSSSSHKNYLYTDIPVKRLSDEPGRFSEVQNEFARSVAAHDVVFSPYVQSLDITGFDMPARLPVLRPKMNVTAV